MMVGAQRAVSALYCDLHSGYDAANDVWLDVNGAKNAGHYYPTALGNSAEHYLILPPGVVDDSGNPLVYDRVDQAPADESDVSKHAISTGLLVNSPGEYSPIAGGVDGTPLTERGNGVSPLDKENGLYLNEMPKSGSAYNGSSNTGQYTWMVSNNGAVMFGVRDLSQGKNNKPSPVEQISSDICRMDAMQRELDETLDERLLRPLILCTRCKLCLA